MRARDSGVPALSDGDCADLLLRLGVDREPPGVAALETLQWAFIRASPFHNLNLLGGFARGDAPETPELAIAEVLSGRGGPCHVQAAGFLSLLLGLGYDAHLAAATIGSPGDHLLSVVHVGGRSFVVDVGNGHPYTTPFPLHAKAQVDRFGWRFVAEPAPGGARLRRLMPDETWKTVWTMSPEPRSFSDFAPEIARHHREPGFGPFLTGLRATRLGEDVIVTLRDRTYTRWSSAGVFQRDVRDARACKRLLQNTFGLDVSRFDDALDVLRANGAYPWQQPHPEPKRRPRFLISVSVTDRPRSFEAFAATLTRELAKTRPDAALLVLENSWQPRHRSSVAATVARFAAAGLSISYQADGPFGRPLAASRVAQREAIRSRILAGDVPDVVWMVDDDLRFAQLARDDHGWLEERTDIDYFGQLGEWRYRFPDVSMALGGVTGAPPVRPEATLRTQLADLASILRDFASRRPEDALDAVARPSLLDESDYYYDHSRAGTAHLTMTMSWLPRREAGPTFAEQLEWLLRNAVEQLASGQALTRPLVYEATQTDEPEPSTLRGGNTVFFDADACLRHDYPGLRVKGIMTRRADMIGCTSLARSGLTRSVSLPFPLLHDRTEQRVVDAAVVRESRVGEFYGVLLARLAMDAHPQGRSSQRLAALARTRFHRIIDGLEAAGREVPQVRAACRKLLSPPWVGVAEIGDLARSLETVLDGLRGTFHCVAERMAEDLLDPDALEAIVTYWERELS